MSEFREAFDDAAHTIIHRFVIPFAFGILIAVAAVQALSSGPSVDYSWFRSQFRLIQTCEAELDSIPSTAPQYPGIVRSRRLAVEEYNNLSRSVPKKDWAADDLPYQIDISLNAE